ncbi:MAG: nucleotidyl transferase AbiEii/AbiGii toxin family protein [Acholeplasmatales bacterium]|jgi:predicted nucleotidyltransferase component of viral defense system|nr:nucleotidyl transferase AbiEii/AbiGii toxin family protein [Acholeplasmatales bacterium]
MILKECFTNEFIESRAGTNIHRKKIYEKVVHAFYLLERLAHENIDFIFKGGTSLMLLLNDFNRYSVDIDILMCKGKEKTISDIILKYTDEVFINVQEDIRDSSEIIKKHYKFFYNSIYSDFGKENPYVLLDIVFDNHKYFNLQHLPIESHFIKTTNPLLSVQVPSIDEMLGDKLTAFAPNTIGVLFRKPNQFRTKHVEIIKQLYDVSKLYDKMSDLNLVRQTYNDIAEIQLKNRGLSISKEECLKDSLETCKLILTEGKRGGSADDFSILKKGYEGFKNFMVNQLTFQELLTMATKTYILCIFILFGKISEIEAKPIDTFIGKRHKYIHQNIGDDLYSSLMKACDMEIKHIKVLV